MSDINNFMDTDISSSLDDIKDIENSEDPKSGSIIQLVEHKFKKDTVKYVINSYSEQHLNEN